MNLQAVLQVLKNDNSAHYPMLLVNLALKCVPFVLCKGPLK